VTDVVGPAKVDAGHCGMKRDLNREMVASSLVNAVKILSGRKWQLSGETVSV
jgi:hypothetical protein